MAEWHGLSDRPLEVAALPVRRGVPGKSLYHELVLPRRSVVAYVIDVDGAPAARCFGRLRGRCRRNVGERTSRKLSDHTLQRGGCLHQVLLLLLVEGLLDSRVKLPDLLIVEQARLLQVPPALRIVDQLFLEYGWPLQAPFENGNYFVRAGFRKALALRLAQVQISENETEQFAHGSPVSISSDRKRANSKRTPDVVEGEPDLRFRVEVVEVGKYLDGFDVLVAAQENVEIAHREILEHGPLVVQLQYWLGPSVVTLE